MIQDCITEIAKNPFLGVVFSLVCGAIGGLIGFLIGNRLAIDRNRIQEFNVAAAKLREAFQPLLIIVNPHQYVLNEELFKILKRDFDGHKQAIIEFFNYLRCDKTRHAFLKAWQEYHCHEGECHENCLPFLEQYWMLGKTDNQRHEIFKLVETRIKNILKFAQPK